MLKQEEFCKDVHKCGTCECTSMLQIATTIMNEGFLSLKEAYTKHFPSVKYKSDHARRRLLQMPLACVRIDFRAGVSECYILEHRPQTNYESIISLLKNVVHKDSGTRSSLSKHEIKTLLTICQSDRERECIRYAIYKASGVTATQARKQFGFEHMNQRSKQVKEALKHALYIRQAIDKLARTKELAVLHALGINLAESDCDTSSGESTDEDEQFEPYNLSLNQTNSSFCLRNNLPGATELIKSSHFNVFEIIARLQCTNDENYISPTKICEELTELLELDELKLDKNETEQLRISCEAYRVDEEINSVFKERAAGVLNGDIVTDSESDIDPDVVSKASTPFDGPVKALIKKKCASIKLQAARIKAKQIAKKNFLGRRVSRKVKGIVKQYPNIGGEIEEFVKSNNVGADQWRRTGVLTFDGNMRSAKKVTYKRIQQHLMNTYGRSFSYGTVIQLCIARNQRRRSAARYHGLAQVTTRRARKGFQLRYNPDFHWSNALYRGLDYIQMTDGVSIVNVNRDDASGFRLDTLATHKQFASPTVRGCDVLTTHTDYVNKYPSVLQTTSYNFTGTPTTPELCAGIVKATPLHCKNPAQHAADFEMLKSQESLSAAFYAPGGIEKNIICVRVDGAADEVRSSSMRSSSGGHESTLSVNDL